MSGLATQNLNASATIKDKNDFPQTVFGIAGGAAAGFGLRKTFKAFLKPYYEKLDSNMDKFTSKEKEALIQEANSMIEQSGIVKKGFNGVIWIDPLKKETEENFDKVIKKKFMDSVEKLNTIDTKDSKIAFKEMRKVFKELTDELEKIDSPVSKSSGKISVDKAYDKANIGALKIVLKGSLKDRLKIAFLVAVAPINLMADLLTGKYTNKKNRLKKFKGNLVTGCFDPLSNRIFTSKPSSVLHEIGHAINENSNFLTKLPNNLKLISMALMPMAILTAIFTKKPKKTDKEQSNNKNSFGKLKDFIHNHIGLVVAGLFTPLLLEEGLASSRAIKHINASKILNETVKNQHNKLLKIAFGTYLITTAAASLVAKTSVFVKDKITGYKF